MHHPYAPLSNVLFDKIKPIGTMGGLNISAKPLEKLA